MNWNSCVTGLIGLTLCGTIWASEPSKPTSTTQPKTSYQSFSGIYPNLSMYNKQNECGIGAVVPWAGKLWVITYAPHKPEGSDDKLYQIDSQLRMTAWKGSVGGTPANRMIHRESQQLNIGPYFIDKKGNIRVISPKIMPGRLTATARHLTDPANKVYIYDMEGRLYEVNVHTLAVKRLFLKAVPGWHGKGAYTSQGRLVVSNNGEHTGMKLPKGHHYEAGSGKTKPHQAGVLAEWDGKTWRIIERQQHVEVTGPGGIYGNTKDDDRLWATGWDHRSNLLRLLDGGQWYKYRLPKGSYTYDGKHGWHTEWPRIREIAPGQMLMTLHGMFWSFPKSFCRANSAGITPLSSYLKIIADVCNWNDKLGFACDDASIFANRFVKISHSNLWFIDPDELTSFGPQLGFGGVWVNESVKAQTPSDPFLVHGFTQQWLHLQHKSKRPANFRIECDSKGNNQWKPLATIAMPANGSISVILPSGKTDCWVRLVPLQSAPGVTAYFHVSNPYTRTEDKTRFASLADIDSDSPLTGGIIRPFGEQSGGRLQMAAWRLENPTAKTAKPLGYYEVDKAMQFIAKKSSTELATLKKKYALSSKLEFSVDAASVIVKAYKSKQQYRLPKTSERYDKVSAIGGFRAYREIATERSLLNCHGSFYELPRISSGGIAKVKPICTHKKAIFDFASWRGMLVLAGCKTNATADKHTIISNDKQVALWLGTIDDLWKFGKPTGHGGPWKKNTVQAKAISDPYLMLGYDKKTLTLQADQPTTVTMQIDPTGEGHWQNYKQFNVTANQSINYVFPKGFQAHWCRFISSKAASITAMLKYE